MVCFRYALTEQMVKKSMRVLVHTAPLACIGTSGLHLILTTIRGQLHAVIY